MPDILRFDRGENNNDINAALSAYYLQLEQLSRQAVRREITPAEYRNRMEDVVTAALFQAFILGGGSLNSREAKLYIDEQRQITFNSIAILGDAIYSGRYGEQVIGDDIRQTEENGLAKLAARLSLWTFALGRVFNRSMLYPTGQATGIDPDTGMPVTPEEPRYIWLYDPRKEHCSDCAKLNGTVLTANEWKRTGIEPQSPALQCGGWRCGCRLQQTDQPSMGMGGVNFTAVAHEVLSHD